MKADSIIVQEVRERAMEISARYDHDLHKYVEYFREIESAFKDRVVNQITIVATDRGPSDSWKDS